MKRHINLLLQRKHTDFDDAQYPRESSQRRDMESGSAQEVLVKDGYDWLHQIRPNPSQAEHHSQP